MTDHPPNPSHPTDQGDNSPSAPGTPQPAGIAPGTTAEQEKDNTRAQGDMNGEKENAAEEKGQAEKEEKEEAEEGEREEEEEEEAASAPPLPDEVPPPLPNEAPPGEDDGWEPVWDANAQAYYFYNRFTGVAQWENPRVPDASGGEAGDNEPKKKKQSSVAGGYNPAIHGDYDPKAPQEPKKQPNPDRQSDLIKQKQERYSHLSTRLSRRRSLIEIFNILHTRERSSFKLNLEFSPKLYQNPLSSSSSSSPSSRCSSMTAVSPPTSPVSTLGPLSPTLSDETIEFDGIETACAVQIAAPKGPEAIVRQGRDVVLEENPFGIR